MLVNQIYNFHLKSWKDFFQKRIFVWISLILILVYTTVTVLESSRSQFSCQLQSKNLTCQQQSKKGLFGDVGVAHVLRTAFYHATSKSVCGAGHVFALRPDQTAPLERRHIVANDDGCVTLVSSTLLLITVTADTHAVNGDIWRERQTTRELNHELKKKELGLQTFVRCHQLKNLWEQ